MIISSEKQQEIIQAIKIRYPGWSGFHYPDFVKDELTYKRNASEKAQTLLGKGAFEQLLANQSYDEIVNRLEKVGQSTNLLYLGVPRGGDLKILYQEKFNPALFCNAMFDLLHGAGEGPERLGRYLAFTQEQGLPVYWTFPTYYLFLFHPETEFFIKPRTVRNFLKQFYELDLPIVPNEKTYATIITIAQALRESLASYHPTDLMDIQSLVWVTATPLKLKELFDEFLETYAEAEKGKNHAKVYGEAAAAGQKNYSDIKKVASMGQDVTDDILKKLLPHANNAPNRQRSAWIHIAPAITKDIKFWYERSGNIDPKDWGRVAQAILEFIEGCVEDPTQVQKVCDVFNSHSFIKGFQTGMLTPILNALRPDDFLIKNNKSRQTLNHFAKTRFQQSILDYASANQAGFELIASVTS